MAAPEKLISVVLPVYNEAENIQTCLRGLWSALKGVSHEILVCYDFDGDSTLPAVASMSDRPATVRLVKNDLGRGVAFAMKAGFQSAKGDVIVTTMADLSDPPEVILAMAKKVREENADVVSGSRYMKGGSQTGGPLLKRTLSRVAGLSLYYVAGVKTHDATTNFRGYSARFLKTVEVESIYGFELALELTTKAHLSGANVSEVPSTWQDRTAGESRFQLWKWMPRYLYWFSTAMVPPAFVWLFVLCMGAVLVRKILQMHSPLFYWDELANVARLTGEAPVTLDWLWEQHNEHRIPLPRLIYLGLAWLAGGWTGIVSLFGAIAMIAVTFGLTQMIQRLRGRNTLLDIFFPLTLLHFGHAENLIYPFQICFVLLPILVFVPLITSQGGTLRCWRLWALALCSICLPLIGGHGAIAGVSFGTWLVINGVLLWKANPQVKLPAIGSFSSGMLTFLLVALYLHGFHGNHLGNSPSHLLTLRTAGNFFAVSVGPAGGQSLDAFIAVILGGCTFVSILLLLREIFRPERRMVALGLGAIIAAVVVTGFAVGQSRAVLGANAGSAARYALLSAPLIVACYVCFALYLDRRFSEFAQFGLMLIVAGALVTNHTMGREQAFLRAEREKSLIAELKAGGDVDALMIKHNGIIYWDPAAASHAVKAMKKAKMGPFKDQ